MAKRLTRAELYDLVWDRPMTKLAREFGLSDVALHKICRKHSIPTPPQGHWAKKAHGKPLKVTPLPVDKTAGAADAILIIHEGAATSESEAMSEARMLAREGMIQPVSVGRQDVSPAIERTLAKLGKARPDRLGLVKVDGNRLITASMRPDSLHRGRLILEALDMAARAAGFHLEQGEDRIAWLAHGEHVGFEVTEVADRFQHTPTDAELSAVARWEAEREASFKRNGYRSDYGRPHIPKWGHRFEGRLAVRLEEVQIRTEKRYWGPIIPRTFADTKSRDVLNMVPRIVSTIAAIAVAKRENREADERRRSAEQEAARLRAEQERRALVERRQAELLDQLVNEHASLAKTEAFAAEFRSGFADLSDLPRTARFQAWLEARIAALRARLAPIAIEEQLVRASLFEDPPGDGQDQSQYVRADARNQY